MADMNFSISKEDMLRSKVLKPGVYVLLIKNISQGPGKNDPQSTTTQVDFTVETGPDPEAVGVPIRYWISEKAAGLAVDFLEKVTNQKIPQDGLANLKLAPLVGRKVKAYIKPEKYMGRDQNKIDGFLPMTA
jgi:hypothetical protein